MIDFEKSLKNKKIFVTGNTGFTGSWVCFWLKSIGAETIGFSLPPNTSPALFSSLNLDKEMKTIFGNICDYEFLKKSILNFQPDLILHLAAQSLVYKGYNQPLQTFNTNVIGTANILEISRYVENLKGILCITTDKVYKNNHSKNKFAETDILGGVDPYSASKSAAEIVIESFAKSFFSDHKNLPVINVARGGNIIGGGDWSKNRLIPDYVRSVTSKKQLEVRSSLSIRPWQHVFDLISGYFLILTNILNGKIGEYAAWNLGPHENENYTVQNILDIILNKWQNHNIRFIENPIKETQNLILNSNKAKEYLNWDPAWSTRESVENAVEWYKGFYNDPSSSINLSLTQLNKWRNDNLLIK